MIPSSLRASIVVSLKNLSAYLAYDRSVTSLTASA